MKAHNSNDEPMFRSDQLPLFPATALDADRKAPALVLMACSASKLARPAAAVDLYQGVLYQSYRVHVRETARPAVLILSSRHGFLNPHAPIEPYDERMSSSRADEMIAALPQVVAAAAWPDSVGKVLLAGGKHYRRVMRAAVASRYPAGLQVEETVGGIGMQRSQLGKFLRNLGAVFQDPLGQHPNGTVTFRRYGWIEAGADVHLRYRAMQSRLVECARVLSLFDGPAGATAEVQVERVTGRFVRPSRRWVAVDDLHPALPTQRC